MLHPGIQEDIVSTIILFTKLRIGYYVSNNRYTICKLIVVVYVSTICEYLLISFLKREKLYLLTEAIDNQGVRLMKTTMLGIVIILVSITIPLYFTFSANNNGEATENTTCFNEYKLVPGGTDAVYSWRIALLVNGSMSFRDYLEDFYKNNTELTWAKIFVLDTYTLQPSNNMPRDCSIKEVLVPGTFFKALVEEVIDGDPGLKGTTIIIYVAGEIIKDKKVLFPETDRPILPGREYVTLLKPARISVKILCICDGKDRIFSGKTIDSYIVNLYTTYLYRNGKVYHLVFSEKISIIDQVYSNAYGTEYQGSDALLQKDEINYSIFKKELITLLDEIKQK